MSYKTIILSDLHLGSKSCRANDIINFLENNECYNLILNGDIIDGWSLSRGSKWKDEHTKVLRKILKMSEKGTNVIWIRGNHDDFLHSYLDLYQKLLVKKKDTAKNILEIGILDGGSIKNLDTYFDKDKLKKRYICAENGQVRFFDIEDLPKIKTKQQLLVKKVLLALNAKK